MFISEFENKENLYSVISEIYKNGDVKKTSFERLPELSKMSRGINSNVPVLLFAC